MQNFDNDFIIMIVTVTSWEMIYYLVNATNIRSLKLEIITKWRLVIVHKMQQ